MLGLPSGGARWPCRHRAIGGTWLGNRTLRFEYD
jgi:hypothetical protein